VENVLESQAVSSLDLIFLGKSADEMLQPWEMHLTLSRLFQVRRVRTLRRTVAA
jgi:hypothetical protein